MEDAERGQVFLYQVADLPRDTGAWGIWGISPTGDRLTVAFYSERNAIPQVVTHEMSDDGRLGDELLDQREGKEGIIRVVNAVIHIDKGEAASFHKWLGEKLDEWEKMKK